MDATPITGQPVMGLGYARRVGPSPGKIGTFLLSPIGWTWQVATLLVAGYSLWAWSGPACRLVPALCAIYGGVILAVAWLARLAVAQAAARHFGVQLRWPLVPRLVLPLVFAATASLIYYGVPAAVTFRLSRSALERAAMSALANPSAASSPRRIGLIFGCAPQVIGTSVYFPVGGHGMWDGEYGYAYRPTGPPRLPLHSNHLNDDAYCRHIDGPWYEWCAGYSPTPGPVPDWGGR